MADSMGRYPILISEMKLERLAVRYASCNTMRRSARFNIG